VIAPLGILMGIPFPAGLQQIARGDDNSSIIPWIWAINGSCSVISAIIAALFAITFGFSFVLRLGSLCYFGAWIMVVTVWQSHFVYSSASEREQMKRHPGCKPSPLQTL